MRASLVRKAWQRRRDIAGAAIYWLGLGRGYAALSRPEGAIILMYHSVASDDLAPLIDPPNRMSPQYFEKQMAFLAKHRNVISLTDLVSQIESGVTPRAGTVCITFDDGYLDNLTIAAPILERFGLPATLFLPTAYIDRAQTQWADELHRSFSSRTLDHLHIPEIGVHADLAVEEERASSRLRIQRHLLESGYESRSHLLTQLEQQLRPAGPTPRLTMNWDDVRELVRRYPKFDVGGHSRHHIDLRTNRSALARDEIAGCAQDLQRELGVAPQHFSFPYGRWHEDTRAMVLAAGWRSAVGASKHLRVGRSTDRYVMSRPDTPNSMTELRFKTSGAYPGALAMVGLR